MLHRFNFSKLVFHQDRFYVFQMPAFLTFLITRIWYGGIQSSSCPGHHQTSARSCQAMTPQMLFPGQLVSNGWLVEKPWTRLYSASGN